MTWVYEGSTIAKDKDNTLINITSLLKQQCSFSKVGFDPFNLIPRPLFLQ